jgi:hypothetical protein
MENKHWTENFRIFTPILVTVACFMLGNLISTTNKIDDKLFKHLTNDEIHAPRSTYVQKAEFDLYQKMRDKQMDSMECMIRDIRNLIKDGQGK